MGADERRSVLQAVSEQLKVVTEVKHRTPGASVPEVWTQEQWWQSFTFVFAPSFRGGNQHGQQDDLLFLVHGSLSKKGQFTVRRRGADLPSELHLSGSQFSSISWKDTFLLNHVLHTNYQLTVIACRQDALPQVAEGRLDVPGIVAVTKQVYASPTRTHVNLDSSKHQASQPAPSYPDICFSVDNFDDAFDDLVLTHADDCYCVMLHALLDHAAGSTGASSSTSPGIQAAPMQPDTIKQDEGTSITSKASDQSQQHPARKLVLFSGYVSYQAIMNHLDLIHPIPALGQWLRSKGGTPLQRDRVYMAGPNGRGQAEVAVTKQQQQQQQRQEDKQEQTAADVGDEDRANSMTAPRTKRFLQNALSFIVGSSSNGKTSSSTVKLTSVGAQPAPLPVLQCALMSMSLPVSSLACDLLDNSYMAAGLHRGKGL